MENKLLAVQEKIAKVEKLLDDVKHFLSEADVPKAIEESTKAESLLVRVTDDLEDLEMSNVDFDGINLDKAFEGDPVSDYVTALQGYVTGDADAKEQVAEALNRITEREEKLSAAGLYESVMDRDAQFAERLLKDLESIEQALEGTDIDTWSYEQVELARYFLSFQPDTSLSEVELLTTHGVGLAWKRRRYLNAAK